MTVAMRPFRRSANRYTELFGAALEDQGLRVIEMAAPLGHNCIQAKVTVLHWPNEFFIWFKPVHPAKALFLIPTLAGAKLFGRKLVWVVHNIVPHQRSGVPVPLLRRIFFGLLDGLIFLSESSRELTIARFPALADMAHVVIPHGVYPSASATAPQPARAFGHPARLAFIGRVMRYKAPEVLARAVAAVGPLRATLHIAGSCPEADLAGELMGLATDQITLDLRFQEEAELEQAIDRADAIVLPYRDIVNSGSAILALGRWRPVLAPRIGSLVELREQVGADWLWLYDGELTEATLEAFLAWLDSRSAAGKPDMSGQQWDVIGRRLANFLRAR